MASLAVDNAVLAGIASAHYCDINATLYQPAAVHISRSLSAYSYRKNCEACMLPFLEHINQLLWGFPVLILLSSAHLYFLSLIHI